MKMIECTAANQSRWFATTAWTLHQQQDHSTLYILYYILMKPSRERQVLKNFHLAWGSPRVLTKGPAERRDKQGKRLKGGEDLEMRYKRAEQKRTEQAEAARSGSGRFLPAPSRLGVKLCARLAQLAAQTRHLAPKSFLSPRFITLQWRRRGEVTLTELIS